MKELNLFQVTGVVRSLELIACELPPMQEVLDAMDAKEMDDERNGRPIPRDALKYLRPICEAARDFQTVCLTSRAAYEGGKGGGL